MTASTRKRRLKKELRLFDVYAIATGTTLSAGFFLLPGLAAIQAGPGLVLAYLIAAVPLVPAVFSILELATAMPRAGGVYYFLDRSLGPMIGAIGGLGTWLALMLKVAFALVGMGAYVSLLVGEGLPIKPLAIGFALALGALALAGARKTGRFQLYLLIGLLAILSAFIARGLPRIEVGAFEGMLDAGTGALLSTAGLVYISFVGVTNVASLSEEVVDPERNIPLGVFLALGTALIVYVLGTMVMVGVVPMDTLRGDLTPVATAAGLLAGRWGVVLVSIAALLAFVSVANAGTLSSSRYPLAMSRDRLLPRFLRYGMKRTPTAAIGVTTGLIVLILLTLDPAAIAKLASAFQLLMFALVCLAVIVMRESGIEAYDPGYHSPLYPWMQIFGIVVPFVIIAHMGRLPALFAGGLIIGSIAWYRLYGRRRVRRSGAIYHLLARLADPRLDGGLEVELRHILREKGLREKDPYDQVITDAVLLEASREEDTVFENVVERVSEVLAERLPATAEELATGFLEGSKIGATPVSKGVSLPHLRLFGIHEPVLVLVRSRSGLFIDVTDVHGDHSPTEPVYCLFFLVSPEEDPKQHLRILAQIAERVDHTAFLENWRTARDEQVLKEILLHDDRYLSLRLRRESDSEILIGRRMRELHLPDGVLVALIHRDGAIKVPRGRTVLRENDRLTIIGSPAEIEALLRRYVPERGT